MRRIQKMSVGELAAYVSSHLRAKGIEVVLSGGSAVTIYSRDKYVSLDTDLVNTRYAKRRAIREAMLEIGFQEENRYFKHPETQYFVEFPAGPLAVGNEPVKRVDEMTFRTGTLRILSPTDCVKDRLTWYYYDKDRQALEQARLVVQENEVDLAEIERWSKQEGMLKAFRGIRKLLVDRET